MSWTGAITALQMLDIPAAGFCRSAGTLRRWCHAGSTQSASPTAAWPGAQACQYSYFETLVMNVLVGPATWTGPYHLVVPSQSPLPGTCTESVVLSQACSHRGVAPPAHLVSQPAGQLIHIDLHPAPGRVVAAGGRPCLAPAAVLAEEACLTVAEASSACAARCGNKGRP